MSVSQWSQMWAVDPEASLRTSFGPGRYSARNDLIKRHNFKGEAVFIASRKWHEAKAESHAADRRLQEALAEADKAKRAEADALERLSYGRPLPSTKSKYVTGAGPSTAFGGDASTPKPPGKFRIALAQRIAEHAAEREAERRSLLRRSARIHARASKIPARPGEGESGGGTRAKWVAKMMAKSANSPPIVSQPAAALDAKPTRSRRAKFATLSA